MTSRGSHLPRPVVWLAVAILGALTGAALQLVAGGSAESPTLVVAADTATSVAGASSPSVDPSRAAPTDDAAPVDPTAAVAPVPGTSAGAAAGPPPTASQQPSEGGPTAAPVVSTGLRLQIPALAVDAPIIELGFAGTGELDVPSDGTSIGWYDISPRPGEPGNALLGAHFDWDGALAVFAGLSRLVPGDRVLLDGGPGALTYEVTESTSVSWDHPVGDVLATTVGGSSLTLFTCGGDFDSARSEYDERVIVRAVLVDSSAQQAARR